MEDATRVPALSAARTVPTSLSATRYRYLPTWQKQFRTADHDYEVASCLRAVASGGRADIVKGVPDGTTLIFDGTGGQLVSQTLSSYFFETLYAFGKMRQMARVFTIGPGQGGSLRVARSNLDSVSTWTAEAIADTAGEPSIDAMSHFFLKKLTNISTMSNELLDDAFGVVDWLVGGVGRQMAEEEDRTLYSDGSTADTDPRGFELTSTTGTTGPASWYVPTLTQSTTFQTETLIDWLHIAEMYRRLPEAEKAGAAWTAGSVVVSYLLQMFSPVGAPVVQATPIGTSTIADALQGQTNLSIFGIPLIQMPANQEAGTPDGDPPTPNTGQNRLYLVNMRRSYGILETGDVEVSMSSQGSAFATDSTRFKFVHRIDGDKLPNATGGVPGPDTVHPTYVYTGQIIGVGTPGPAP